MHNVQLTLMSNIMGLVDTAGVYAPHVYDWAMEAKTNCYALVS